MVAGSRHCSVGVLDFGFREECLFTMAVEEVSRLRLARLLVGL